MKKLLILLLLTLVSCSNRKTPMNYSPQKYDELKRECLNIALDMDVALAKEKLKFISNYDYSGYECEILINDKSFYFKETAMQIISTFTLYKDSLEDKK